MPGGWCCAARSLTAISTSVYVYMAYAHYLLHTVVRAHARSCLLKRVCAYVCLFLCVVRACWVLMPISVVSVMDGVLWCCGGFFMLMAIAASTSS